MPKIIEGIDYGLTDEQKERISSDLEKLMASVPSELSKWYRLGIIDGLNNAFKLINGVDDDYNYRSGKETKRRGRRLTTKEALALSKGDEVWFYFRRHDEAEPRIDKPTRVNLNDRCGSIVFPESDFTIDPELALDEDVRNWEEEGKLYWIEEND